MNSIRKKFRCAILFAVFGVALEANGQLVITSQPQDRLNVPVGANISFSVLAQGNGGLSYQWRLNGVNIPNATNNTLFIQNVLPQKSGNYSVAVSDQNESINSVPARLTVNIQSVPGAALDSLINSFPPLNGQQGVLRSDSGQATKEVGEPNHNGKRGGKSIWFKWITPMPGIVTFAAGGSGFDTLLAAYTGRTISGLVPVPSAIPGDDRGGFLTSLISFNVEPNEEYQIALDGFAGAGGDVVLSWNFEPTPDVLPTITFSSPGRVVGFGQSLLLLFGSDVPDAQGTWFFNDQPTQVTGNQFPIDGAKEEDVGTYETRVVNPKNQREVRTLGARVQINLREDGTTDAESRTYEKFLEAADAAFTRGGASQRPGGSTNSADAGGLASGYSSSQIFSTVLSSKDAGEPNHCSEAGGASEWYTYQPSNSGTLQINTDGSSFNTVLAVYTGPGTDYASLVSVACDNVPGSGRDRVVFQGSSGKVYFIAVDGVGGARGTAYLNVNFGDPPLIVTPPTNQVVAAGSNATFTVFASGSGPLRYRWQFNGTNILNATNSSYTVTNVQEALTGNYTVTVSNVVAVVTSSPPAVLSLRTPPVITVQPTNQSVTVTSNVTFSVTATGNPAPAYQWRFGVTNLPGATNLSLVLTNVQTNQAGIYSVVVSNAAGSVTSSNATLTVNTPPVITGQPTDQSVTVTSNVTFSVTATGNPAPAYQWRFGVTNLPGATNLSLVLTNVQTNQAGIYSVVVSNAAGSVTSSNATLTVNTPPVITGQPTDQSVTVTSNVTFSVIASGNPAPTYQWRFGATNLPGATGSSFTRTNVQTNHAGIYSVVVSNVAGNMTSSNATLTVNTPPVFTLAPMSQTSNIGATVMFTASATGSPPVTYQWRFGGFGDIAGQTNSSLSVTNVQVGSAGNYRVVASNVVGSVMSAIAVLTVNTPPVITQQPLTQTVAPGSNPALTVVATGTPSPTYQWRINTTNLSGENAAMLSLLNFQTNNEGDYSVVVSNSVGTVLSSNATLALNGPLRIGSFSLASGIAQVQMIGIAGSNYIFQAATNLDVWTSLRTNLATN